MATFSYVHFRAVVIIAIMNDMVTAALRLTLKQSRHVESRFASSYGKFCLPSTCNLLLTHFIIVKS